VKAVIEAEAFSLQRTSAAWQDFAAMEGPGRSAATVHPQVTIAVVSWNTRDLLETCLRSIAPEVDARRAEVWVVDNDSSDGSPDMVEAQFPWARLVRSGANLGFGRAVNLVAGCTAAPWIAPANADIELTPGALETLLTAGEEDPRAGCLAPRLILPDGSTQPSVQRFPSLWLTLRANMRLRRLPSRLGRRLADSAYWDPDRPDRVEWATGAFLLVRRSAWRRVSGFDESQWMYAEDLDLCWRLAQAGWATRYVPTAVAHHHHAAAAVKAFGGDSERRRREIVATYRWLAQRRGVANAWAVAVVNLAGAVAEVVVFSLLAAAQPSRYAERAARARRSVGRAALGLRSPRSLLTPEP
jgi:N-acetylglucosaminyl-diphospho-decaprenol L-rhamnosyltransferase